MHKLFVIACREYAAMVATKAFLVSLIMMPVLMFGGLLIMPKLNQLGGGKIKRIVVVDGTGRLFQSLKGAAELRNETIKAERSKKTNDDASSDDRRMFLPQSDFIELSLADQTELDDAQRISLSNEIRDGSLYAFVEIPSQTIDERAMAVSVPFVGQDAMLSSERQWMNATVQELVRTIRLKELGVDTDRVAQASMPIQFVPTSPFKASKDGTAESSASDNPLIALLLPFGIMMLMFLVIFLAAQPMMESGMEEKSQRIAEVLLGSVNPTQLMAGKLLGNVAGSMMIFGIYGIGGWFVADFNDWTKNLNWTLLPWFVVFQLLGVLFFSSIFLTVGASTSEVKEAQSILMPVWLVMLAPMMVWMVAIREPNGPVATALSFFPPSTPLIMILRLASGQTIPFWQPPLAAVLLVAATIVVISMAGRIYRASLLRNDSARSLRQMMSRLRGN